MPKPTPSELQIDPIHVTAGLLQRRVIERFPDSGLSRVCAELVSLTGDTGREIERLRRPLWGLRLLMGLAVVGVVSFSIWATLRVMRVASGEVVGVAELLQGLEAATNELIFLGLVVLFLTSLETRVKRRRALRALHRLRSIAHVVDMHQLTKDPEYALRRSQPTASSPERTLSAGELARYLDYCSEMLSLIGKLAALHAQHLQDPVVLNAVNDIEGLTSGLSGKIWQKITILDISSAAEGGVNG